MSAIWLACSLFLSSVEWSSDPEAEESQFQTSEADALPGHIQGFFDLASTDVVNLASVHNRLSLFEPIRLSLHGFSWTSLRYEIDDLHLLVSSLRWGACSGSFSKKIWLDGSLARAWSIATPTLLTAKLDHTFRFFVAEFVAPVEGTTLLPHGFMDREPALPTETPRRQENVGYRVVMKEGIQQRSGMLRLVSVKPQQATISDLEK